MLALFVKIPAMYVYERSAISLRIPNILRITVRYSASHILAVALLVAKCHKQTA